MVGRFAKTHGSLAEDDGTDHLLGDEAAASEVVFKRLHVACVQRLCLGNFVEVAVLAALVAARRVCVIFIIFITAGSCVTSAPAVGPGRQLTTA